MAHVLLFATFIVDFLWPPDVVITSQTGVHDRLYFLPAVLVILHVADSQSKTDLIDIFGVVPDSFEAQMLFRMMNAALALLIHAAISRSVPQWWSVTQPEYTNGSASFIGSPAARTGVFSVELIFLSLSPIPATVEAWRVVLSRVCCRC